jgi:4-hydroxybenzoate polyprenyltransferase
MGLQALAAFAVLLTFPPAAIWVGVAALAPVAVYPFAKRFTWWPQVFLGVAFNWGVPLAWAAHGAPMGPAPLLLYLAGIAWTLFYDTIYAHQDREDDALIGVKSTARLFGTRTRAWLAGFAAAAVALAALSVWMAVHWPLDLWLGLAGVAAFGLHLAWQLLRLDIDDPARCLMLFRANRDAGLLLALGLALAAWK